MMGVGTGGDAGATAALTSLMSPLNTTSSALSRSIFSFISSWMASASCAACRRGQAGFRGSTGGARNWTPGACVPGRGAKDRVPLGPTDPSKHLPKPRGSSRREERFG